MLQQTLRFIDALYQNEDPATGESLPPDSIFTSDRVRYALANLRSALRGNEYESDTLTDEVLKALCDDLRADGFAVSAAQLTHILRGSRRVIDPLLRSLSVFGKYRGEYSRQQLSKYCEGYLRRQNAEGDTVKARQPKRKPKPWKDEPFFKNDPFDQLEEKEYARLSGDIADLGLKRSGDSLPDFIANIRKRLPRSYEPWTAEERALLLEAMCYTNDGEKLGRLFGRGAKSVTEEGKRLIYLSKQEHAERA